MVRKWNRVLDLFYTFNGVKWVYIANYESLKEVFKLQDIDLDNLSDDELLELYEQYEDELTFMFKDKAEKEWENEI